MRIITATYLIYLEGFINIVNFTFTEKNFNHESCRMEMKMSYYLRTLSASVSCDKSNTVTNYIRDHFTGPAYHLPWPKICDTNADARSVCGS